MPTAETRLIPSGAAAANGAGAGHAPVVLEGRGRAHGLAIGALVLVFGGVYLATLHPGVDYNDRAEMQHVVPLLGIAHPPGYSIMMVVGKLFSALPFPGTVAYRLNLLQAVWAVVSLVLLYSIVRRITGQLLPGIVAAGVLGFSSVYWQSAVIAEVYVFYGMFLLIGIYLLVRHIESGGGAALMFAALSLGVCCWNRPSELFVMPAFVLLWLAFMRRFKLNVLRVVGVVLMFLLPLAFSIAYFLVRYDENAIYVRDDVQRDHIRNQYEPMAGFEHFGDGVRYTLGLKWSAYSQGRRQADRFRLDRDKLMWLLLGRNAFETNIYAQIPGSSGVSVGLPAILLGLLAVAFYARRPGWWLLGLGLIVGNTAFYFYHVPSNNLDFLTPGIIGFALLAGLGTAALGGAGRRPGLRVLQVLCLVVPLLPAWANYRAVNRNTPEERARQVYLDKLAEVELPRGAVILAMRQSAMVYRYLYHVQAGRRDISVVSEKRTQFWPALAQHYQAAGRPVFVREATPEGVETHGVSMPEDMLTARVLAALTRAPGELGEMGFFAWP